MKKHAFLIVVANCYLSSLRRSRAELFSSPMDQMLGSSEVNFASPIREWKSLKWPIVNAEEYLKFL